MHPSRRNLPSITRETGGWHVSLPLELWRAFAGELRPNLWAVRFSLEAGAGVARWVLVLTLAQAWPARRVWQRARSMRVYARIPRAMAYAANLDRLAAALPVTATLADKRLLLGIPEINGELSLLPVPGWAKEAAHV